MNNRLRTSSLESRLRPFVQSGDAEGLLGCLQSMSVADRRKSHSLLPAILTAEIKGAEAFWTLFDQVVQSFPKAYLVTFLKAVSELYKKGLITLKGGAARDYCGWMTQTDKRKTTASLLPLMATPEEVEDALDSFRMDEAEERISALTPIRTMPCRYALFNTLKTIEGEEGKIRSCCLALMKQNERFSFNLASIISVYFAIENLPGTFSLRMKPYEQCRLDGSYSNFCKLINSI